ncbi:hypothetical protein GYMLUDRAFT_67631 [Collybiopsis luxurians FD-317 M1]|nr:hypothetical protein GYMLUDRAFT_67631 [Collybiopsis luxurians FD-317 M1]
MAWSARLPQNAAWFVKLWAGHDMSWKSAGMPEIHESFAHCHVSALCIEHLKR